MADKKDNRKSTRATGPGDIKSIAIVSNTNSKKQFDLVS